MVPKKEILPLIELKGTSEEIGYEHGSRLKDRVRANYDFYTRKLFARPDFDFQEYGKAFFDILADHCPEYAAEIDALATGAGMQAWQIMVLNARTEVFLQANKDLLKECTALYFPQPAILGQNWDWMRPLESLMVLTDICKNNHPRILMMTEPGIIGKIGMNQNGIGVCLNILLGYQPITAIPIHILLRKILECSSLEEVWAEMTALPTGTYSHALVGDAHGNHLSLEFGFDQVHKVAYDHPIPLHANQFICHPYDAESGDNPMLVDSRARTLRAETLRAEIECGDLASMKKILLDRENDKLSICKDYQEVWNTELGTLCTVIMELKDSVMHLSKGNPIYHEFVTYHLA